MELSSHLSGLIEACRESGGAGRLSLLRWQLERGDSLGDRKTLPGHVTTSAIVVSPDLSRTLLVHHRLMGRWQPPGGHYEDTGAFWRSAAREALEETGVEVTLHSWHRDSDEPLMIVTQDVPGNPRYGERDHVHHDLQYLLIADEGAFLRPQDLEVAGARWFPLKTLEACNPQALLRLRRELATAAE